MTVLQCREIAHKTQEEMAKMLGITLEEYSVYEQYPFVMPIHIAVCFSEIVMIPCDHIFFGANSI